MKRDLDSILGDTPRLLLRSDLCFAAGDPKLGGGAVPVYVPLFDHAEAVKTLSNPAQIRPFDPEADASGFMGPKAEHGLLYLPFPYLVPGGRFNEMYGWDSAFPVFAWTDSHPDIMRAQVDNQLYQIRMYGKVLNANRTYYLSRSQPPLVAAMTRHVWDKAQGRAWSDFDPTGLYADAKAWLAQAFRDLEAYYRYWTHNDRLAGGGPLSRYWDDGDVPAPEVVSGEEGHFAHARAYFQRKDLPAEMQADRDLFIDEKTGDLTGTYYRADRAMRAAGFDPTGHWGYGALRCMFHAPVCLNALLYRMENDMAALAAALGMPAEDAAWTQRAIDRAAVMRELMYDPETGLYHDYDLVRHAQNRKPFGSGFHAFWAGLYDDAPDDAARAAAALLKDLETPFGLSTSNEVSGSQWDHPYGWPPLQYFAFAGLARAGLTGDSKRIARKFADLTARVFAERGALFEKYNVADGNADIHVVHGYHENVTESGTFLWTAAVLTMARDSL